MIFALFLGIINVFKLWVSRYIPLLGDEAYYYFWSKHPALSYTDHPPMIAWLHGFSNFVFGQSDLGVRATAILLLLLSTGLIYLIGKEAFGKKVGIASAVVFNLIPTFFVGGLFLTPEQPLIIFWLMSLFFAVKIVKGQQKYYWYLLGLSLGLGLLSKFPMLLFIPSIFIFLILSKENRHWFKAIEPYLALVVALFTASPVIIWNIQNNFPSLAHHGARLGSPNYINNILYFLVLQFLMFSPPLFVLTCKTFFYDLRKKFSSIDALSLLFITLSLVPFLAFALVSPFTLVGGHWTSIIYLGVIVLLSQKLIASPIPLLKNKWIWIDLGIIIFINALFVSYYAFLYPIPEELKGKAYSVDQELAQYVQNAKVKYVFSNQMGVASLVAFYGKTEVYMPKGLWKQFDIWGQPELEKGDSILYFAFDQPDMEKKLRPLFGKVAADPTKRLFIKDSDIAIKTTIYKCENYKGGILP